MAKRVYNKDLMAKLNEIGNENKKTKGITMVALGFAFIAIAIPMILQLIEIPEQALGFIAVFYFVTGVYIILKTTGIKIEIKEII